MSFLCDRAQAVDTEGLMACENADSKNQMKANIGISMAKQILTKKEEVYIRFTHNSLSDLEKRVATQIGIDKVRLATIQYL